VNIFVYLLHNILYTPIWKTNEFLILILIITICWNYYFKSARIINIKMVIFNVFNPFKPSEPEADHSPPSGGEIKNGGTIPPLSNALSCRGAYIKFVKHFFVVD
jgi:hypothetical protein